MLLNCDEPKACKRTVWVVEHRGKADFVAVIGELLARTYMEAQRLPVSLAALYAKVQRIEPAVLRALCKAALNTCCRWWAVTTRTSSPSDRACRRFWAA